MLGLATRCSRVSPDADFDRARESIADRTGAGDAYDPRTDAAIDDRVLRLLDDGLTGEEAVQVALLNNRAFQALFQTIGASRADVVQSGLLTNPSIGFSARFPEGGGRSDLNFSFAQELVDLWQVPVRRRIAEAQLEQTVMDVVREGVDLAARTRIKCYELLALGRREKIIEENLMLVEQSLELAQRRLAAGEAAQFDINLLRASLLDARTTLIATSRDKRVARAELANLLGLSRLESDWSLNDAFESGISTVPADSMLILQAMRERPDALAAARRVTQAESEIKRQKLSVFASVSLGVEGERNERRALPGRKILADTARASVRAGQLTAPDIQTRAERDFERRQIIDSLLGPSLQITLPIWDQNQAQIAKAVYNAEAARKRYESLLDSVAEDVQRSAALLRAAGELAIFYRDQGLPQAMQNLDLARRAYEGGELNILGLIEAQRHLIDQRLAAVNVTRDYLVAVAELQRALGGRIPAMPASAPAATQAADGVSE